jgi:tetratricopeptide (TPR) repeat protein
LFNKAIALDEKVLAKEPKNVAGRENLAMSKISPEDAARARGDSDQALTYNREAIPLLESVAKDEPANMEHKKTLWNASYNLGLTLMQLGRAAEALAISRRIYGSRSSFRKSTPRIRPMPVSGVRISVGLWRPTA